jgi:1-deoxy-D-xylulose-5-phosphate synthase
MTLLDQIRNPADLRALPKEQVPVYAEAVQACLMRHGARIGAESVEAERGVVDLVVALHRVFDFQRDRLVLDASHPALAHKVITGRRRRLASLDRADGLSRHMHRGESPYDVLTTGHAGTAISLAAGMARADAIRGVGGRRIVALLDQQATGTGIALEALNEIGGTDTNLLVVVHDSEFAFQRTTGSLRRYLNRMRTLPGYREGKKELLDALGGLPFVGGGLSRWAGNVKEAVANYLSPGHLFREFGWTYFGPENGHDVLKLEQLLLDLQRVEGPVLLHVVTDQRRGTDALAIGQAASTAAGAGSGRAVTPSVDDKAATSFEDALGAGLTRALRHDPRVVAILPTALQGARRGSHGASCGLDRLAAEQPERVFLAGPSPAHAMAMAAGMAELGMRPVCVLRAADVARAHDQLWQEITLQSLPVVVVLQGVGLADAEGPADARTCDLAWLRTLPGLTVLGPADGAETGALLRHALASPGPSVLRLPQRADSGPALPGTDATVRQGRPVRLRRGADIVLVADGTTAAAAYAAAERLAVGSDGQEALACRVVHARFLQPLEAAAWQQALRGARLGLVVEEHVEAGGLGQALLAMHGTTSLGASLQLRQHAVPGRLLQGGDAATWRQRFGLDAAGIAARVRQEWRALEVDVADTPDPAVVAPDEAPERLRDPN